MRFTLLVSSVSVAVQEHCARVLHHVNRRMKLLRQRSVNVIGKEKYESRKRFERRAKVVVVVAGSSSKIEGLALWRQTCM
jgi:hypothetical protein